MKNRLALMFLNRTRTIAVKIFNRKVAYSLRYFHNRGKFPNLSHPKDLSEILIAKILSNEFVLLSPYVDKITVREYVKSKGLGNNLLAHYHYFEDADDISLDILPEKFVLKTNNGSGGHNIFVCREKKNFDLDNAKKQLAKAMAKSNPYETQYSPILPRIICEELIETDDGKAPIDYKFMCLHGEPYDVMVGINRDKNGVKISRRDLSWTDNHSTRKQYSTDAVIEKPVLFDEMLAIARKLSGDFDIVRVDLYEYKNKVYFGELTFSPAGGILGTYKTSAIKKMGEIYRNFK